MVMMTDVAVQSAGGEEGAAAIADVPAIGAGAAGSGVGTVEAAGTIGAVGTVGTVGAALPSTLGSFAGGCSAGG
jgi:hypothetical protein